MPEPVWNLTGYYGGSTPITKRLPQSEFFNAVNAGVQNNPAYSAAQLGELWRFAQPKPQTIQYSPNPAPIDPSTGAPLLSFGGGGAASAQFNPAASLPVAMAPMVPPPVIPAVNLSPTTQDVAAAIEHAKQVDAANRAYYEQANPGSTATNVQLSRNIADTAAGRLAPEDQALILQQGAEMGARMGVPGSPSAIAGTLARYYGGIQALKDKAEALASSQYARTPKPTDVGQFLTKPEQQIQLVIENARLTQAALTANQEAALRLQLQQMVESGKGLDRQLSLQLKEMEQAGQIRHDETVRLIADADRIAGNYRAGLANEGANWRAEMENQGQNYRANVAAQSQYNLGNLRYGQGQPVQFPQDQSYQRSLPSFSQVFGGGGGGGGYGYDESGTGSSAGNLFGFDPTQPDYYGE